MQAVLTVLRKRRGDVSNFYWKTNITLKGVILGLYVVNMSFI